MTMHSTKIKISSYSDCLPELIRLEADEENHGDIPAAALIYEDEKGAWFQMGSETFVVHSDFIRSMLGDVILVNKRRQDAERIIRRNSQHNTFLVTERCDQLCIMCSQPPKNYELDLFSEYSRAVLYSKYGATIGISGGEPLLYKEEIFKLIKNTHGSRPDIQFHILTNAQHISNDDLSELSALPLSNVRFAVPIYSSDPRTHDSIVGKPLALNNALDGIAALMAAGANVEIRTVILQQNIKHLREIASMLVWNMPDIDHWAIMQLEYIGYAKLNWEEKFFDHSLNVKDLLAATDLARQHGVTALLYNMPLCTLPKSLRELAPSTISDWKKKFFDLCNGCSAKSSCSGFFAWQPLDSTFKRLATI